MTQIATTFKDYDDRLILESMNEVEYKTGNHFDYNSLYTLTQAFVDIARGLGGKNANRLLLISSMNTNLKIYALQDKKCLHINLIN